MTHGFVWNIINMLGILFHSVEETKEINKCQLLALCSNYWKKSLFLSAYFSKDAKLAAYECDIYCG